MICSVRVNEVSWDQWLANVAETRRLRDVELPATAIEQDADVLKGLHNYGLSVHHVRELLPESVSRYLPETTDRVRNSFITRSLDILHTCSNQGVEWASLDLGLDRPNGDNYNGGMEVRTELLKRIADNLGDANITICPVVRCPAPYPGSKAWQSAANLIHDIMHPNVHLTVNLHPAELDEDFDALALVRDIQANVPVVRLFYENDSPLHSPRTDSPQSPAFWFDILRQRRYKGLLVFCPLSASEHKPEPLERTCREIDELVAENR